MMLPVLGRDEDDRRAMFESIGPIWDGNEVWLVVAGGATFAAFPRWYATMFSGFYLALLLILLLLIVRVVSFEWRGKLQSDGWRRLWTWMNFAGSLGVPLLWGIALSSLLRGVPIAANQDYAGGSENLFSIYSVLGGVALVLLFAMHGAVYLSVRTRSGLSERARQVAARLSPLTVVVGAAFLAWTLVIGIQQNGKGLLPGAIPAAVGALALIGAALLVRGRRDGRAFAATAVTVMAVVATLFVGLYPRVMVSAPAFANSLTIQNSSSSQYTLTVMTVAAGLLLPLVLVYQAWSYRVFRARIGGEQVDNPADLIFPRTGTDTASGE
jgi:cytochrome bd ubiquinol oxidase subunit II